MSPNEAAVSRLNQLRSIFPFAEEYQSRGEWILPNGLTPSVDETIKNIPRRNLHLGSDIAKNVAWGNIIEARYVLSSYYQVLQIWHTHRQLALQIVRSFTKSLGGRRAANGVLSIDLTPSAISMYTDFEKASRHIPSLPPQASTILKDDDRKVMTKWTNSFQGFLTGLLQVASGNYDGHAGARIVYLFQDAWMALSEVRSVCADVFRDVPDYFDSQRLDEQEARLYPALATLLDAWLVHPPSGPYKDMRSYAASLQASLHRKAISTVATALASLQDPSRKFLLPAKLIQHGHMQTLSLGFPVANPCDPFRDLNNVMQILNVAEVNVDGFWLVPLLNGRPLPDLAYNISSRTLRAITKGEDVGWEPFVPQLAPPEVLEALGNPEIIQDLAFDIQRRIVALITGVSVVRSLESLLLSKSRTASEWSRRSLERDVLRCQTYRGEYIALADSILQVLTNNSATCESEQGHLSVIEQVAVVREHLTAAPLGELKVDVASLEECADRLFC